MKFKEFLMKFSELSNNKRHQTHGVLTKTLDDINNQLLKCHMQDFIFFILYKFCRCSFY